MAQGKEKGEEWNLSNTKDKYVYISGDGEANTVILNHLFEPFYEEPCLQGFRHGQVILSGI